ncbi:MAG: hypothetical protein ACRDP4_06465 [Nocardioidaceae bacterium]
MRRTIRISALGVVVAVAVGLPITAVMAQRAESGEVVLAHGADRFPSQTASDWVTYADYVVAVSAVAEEEIPPTKEALAHGEGVILREMTLKVDQVLWARGGARKPAPASFTWTAFGWTFTDGSTANRTEMAGAGEPRIETGHRYIMAIDWQPARCAPGDFIPGQWRGLGDGSTVPFDGKSIGKGEMQGKEQTVAQARAAADPTDPNYGLKDRMAGRGAGALAKVLSSATPATKKQFGPPPAQTSCG